MREEEANKRITFTIRLDKEGKDRLSNFCFMRDLKVSEFVRTAITNELDRREANEKQSKK